MKGRNDGPENSGPVRGCPTKKGTYEYGCRFPSSVPIVQRQRQSWPLLQTERGWPIGRPGEGRKGLRETHLVHEGG